MGKGGNKNHWPKGDPLGRGGQFAPSGNYLGFIEGNPNYKKEKTYFADNTPSLQMRNGREKNDKKRLELLNGKYENYKEIASAISNWLYEDGNDTERLDEFIDKTPAYNGIIYRGLHFSEKSSYLPFAKLNIGDKIRMKGNASWTTNKSKAEMFGAIGYDEIEGVFSVLIICDNNKTSVSINNLSEFHEDEVLSHSKAEWKVMEVVRFRDNPEGLMIRVEEDKVC